MDSIVKYRASCPICGHTLFKGTPNSHIDVNCPKCGQLLQISFEEESVISTMITKKTACEGKEMNKYFAEEKR